MLYTATVLPTVEYVSYYLNLKRVRFAPILCIQNDISLTAQG